MLSAIGCIYLYPPSVPTLFLIVGIRATDLAISIMCLSSSDSTFTNANWPSSRATRSRDTNTTLVARSVILVLISLGGFGVIFSIR